jgi:AraC-like DNA-binding protein
MARSSCAHYCGSHFDFGIFLKPLALWQLFRIPPAVLADRDGDSRDVIGNSIHTFWLQLAESKTFQQRIQVAEEYLLPFAVNARPQTLVMKTAQFIYRHQGMVQIQDLADYSSLSLRQYERRFVTEIGFTPKLFARVARFEMALDTKRIASGQSWLTVAHQLGYFDQMHMVRDFQQLGGDVPSEIFQQIGDIHPWSLAPPANPPDFSDPGQRHRYQKWA